MNIEDNYDVLKLYIRNLSVESPLTGRLPPQVNQPNIDIDIDPLITRVEDNLYEVAARFLVSARANGTPLFLIELTQAGFFSISPSGEAQTEALLRRVFPQLIFPAARSNIANSIIAAGYQPIILDHIVLENFFLNVPVVDKRRLAPVQPPKPIAPEMSVPVVDAPVAPAHRKKPASYGRRSRPLVVSAGLGTIALLLVLQADLQQYVTGLLEEIAGPVAAQAPVVSSGLLTVARKPGTKADAPPAVQNGVSAEMPGRLLQIGSNWLAAQNTDNFTVELLRTTELGRVASLTPVEEGQPLFLVKLAGSGNAEYVILSGVYRDEDQARQAVGKSGAAYRVVRFRDYR